MSCTPTGSPPSDLDIGTVIAGMPARLAGTVNTSLRYISSGSCVCSPSLKGSVGGAGGSRVATRESTWSQSRTMSEGARGEAGEGGAHSKHVVEIHLERIVRLLSELEG